jgi:hypothetical protein
MDDSVPDSYSPQPPASPDLLPIEPEIGSGAVDTNSTSGAVTKVESKAPKPPTGPAHTKAVFASPDLTLDLRYVTSSELENVPVPTLSLKPLELGQKGHKGQGVYTELIMEEGQVVTFVIRSPPQKAATSIAQPTRMQADRLGVDFDGKLFDHQRSALFTNVYECRSHQGSIQTS